MRNQEPLDRLADQGKLFHLKYWEVNKLKRLMFDSTLSIDGTGDADMCVSVCLQLCVFVCANVGVNV